MLRSFDRRKQVFVITKDTQLVCDFITDITSWCYNLHGEGGYTKQVRPVIFAFTARQTMELKRFLAQSPVAFRSFQTPEVVGEGFNTERL